MFFIKSDRLLDAQWLKEAEDRFAAYRTDELTAIDAGQVFADLGKQV
ncbi:addiction module protein [uncultured Nitrosomonas sp.]